MDQHTIHLVHVEPNFSSCLGFHVLWLLFLGVPLVLCWNHIAQKYALRLKVLDLFLMFSTCLVWWLPVAVICPINALEKICQLNKVRLSNDLWMIVLLFQPNFVYGFMEGPIGMWYPVDESTFLAILMPHCQVSWALVSGLWPLMLVP
jgi:hypothetical protein